MKKIFTLLCILMLGAGMSAWADADYFTWAQANSYSNKYLDDNNARRCDLYKWQSSSVCWVYLGFFHQKGSAVTYTTPNNGTWVVPNKGSYYVKKITSTSETTDICAAYDSNINGWVESYITWNGTGAYYLYTSGARYVTIDEGVDGPYIAIAGSVEVRSGGTNYTHGGIYIGSPAVYRSVSVVSNDNTMGTVSYEMKSGYLYTNNITDWKNGSTYTLTATPQEGYRFVRWSDEGARVHDVTISGNATYTAYFEEDRELAEGAITGVPDDENHGSVTVSPSGKQAGGTAVTLTANPSYDYQFIKWNDGVMNASRTVYVDGDKDYTAMFARINNIYSPAYFLNGTGNSPAWVQMVGESNDFRILMTINTSYTQGTFTTADFALANCKIIDKNVNETIMVSSVIGNASVTLNSNIRTFEGTIIGDNGLYYHVTMEATNTSSATYDEGGLDFVGFHLPNTNLSSSCSDKYDGVNTFSDANTNYIHANGTGIVDGVNSRLLPSVELFKQSGSIPTGVYPINNSQSAGTARIQSVINDYWDAATLMNGCHVYVDNASSKGYDLHTWFIRAGRVNVVNTSGNYFIDVQGFNTNRKRISYTAGTKPSMTLTANGENGGTVTLTASAYADQTGSGTYQYGTWVTLTPTPSSAFVGWEGSDHQYIIDNGDGSFKVKIETKNLTLQAKFASAPTHTVTFYDYDGTTELQTGDVEEGTRPTYTEETPTRVVDDENYLAYEFAGWRSSADGQVYTAELPEVAEDEVTYTAVYDEYFRILDNKENGDDYYTALASKVGQTINVKYERTFDANQWHVFSLPFGYSYRIEANQTFRGKLYYLVSMKYTKDGYLTLNCMPATGGFAANKPHILILPEGNENAITNPTFKGVTIKALAQNYYSVQNMETAVGGSVEFRNTKDRELLEKDKHVIYINNNRLYYPNLTYDSWMRPFRGYFYLDATIKYAPSRVRLVTEKGEQIETLPEAAEETSVETKKYIENGILV
ncbi:MAG: hypothetical protein J6T32_04365, partial [Paludibacteraceae bacterium]|nr:hypothetical protein [Paludibacteraceae bacterium]